MPDLGQLQALIRIERGPIAVFGEIRGGCDGDEARNQVGMIPRDQKGDPTAHG